MQKITTAEAAAKVFNEHRYADVQGWHFDPLGNYVEYGWSSYPTTEACTIANHLSGYYATLEAENAELKAQIERRAQNECECGHSKDRHAPGGGSCWLAIHCLCPEWKPALGEAQKEQENG